MVKREIKFCICGTNGLAARPKCGCELSPRPYFFSGDRLFEGKATEKENNHGTLISRLFLSADSRTPTCMRELSHGPDGSVTSVKKEEARQVFLLSFLLNDLDKINIVDMVSKKTVVRIITIFIVVLLLKDLLLLFEPARPPLIILSTEV